MPIGQLETPKGMILAETNETTSYWFLFHISVLTFVFSILGIITRPDGSLAALWPANALLLGLFIRCPHWAKPSGWIVAFAAYIVADMLMVSTWPKTLLLAVTNVAGVMVGYYAFNKLDKADRQLKRPMSVIFLIVIILCMSVTAGILGGIASPLVLDMPAKKGFELWFATEFGSYIAILPMILTIPSLAIKPVLKRRIADHIDLNPVFYLPAVFLISCGILGTVIDGPGAIAYPVPALLWCALTYSLFATSVLTLLFCLWALLAISLGLIAVGVDVNDHFNMISLRTGVAMIALAPLTVASVMSARNELLVRLERYANFDSLTNVSNRNGFYTNAHSLLKDMGNRNEVVSILMMDLDNFKQINDDFGHAAGDSVLVEFAQCAQECLRSDDLIGRLGGEEFAVILPRCGPQIAGEIAERIRKEFSQRTTRLNNGSGIDCTVSIGVATAVEPPYNIDKILHHADEALYRAKDGGRNRVASTLIPLMVSGESEKA